MMGRCPNCREPLEEYRVERQSTEVGEVTLHWLICRRCRHVALAGWKIPALAMSGGDRGGEPHD